MILIKIDFVLPKGKGHLIRMHLPTGGPLLDRCGNNVTFARPKSLELDVRTNFFQFMCSLISIILSFKRQFWSILWLKIFNEIHFRCTL